MASRKGCGGKIWWIFLPKDGEFWPKTGISPGSTHFAADAFWASSHMVWAKMP